MSDKSLLSKAIEAIKLGKTDAIARRGINENRYYDNRDTASFPIKYYQDVAFHFQPINSDRVYTGVLTVYASTKEEVTGEE